MSDTAKKELAERLKLYMSLKGVSVPKLTLLSRVNYATIYGILRGNKDTRHGSVRKVAEGLDVPLALLVDHKTIASIMAELRMVDISAIAEKLGVPINVLVG